MKTILAIMLLALPMVAAADYIDVIEFKLKDGCSLDKQMQITNDFNAQWGAKYGYKAEVMTPVYSQDLVSLYWVGRTKDAATFGKAWDAWRDELANPNSVASKLWARFQACEDNLARRGYDVH